MTLELRFQPYRLFPYERQLARREVAALGLQVVSEETSLHPLASALECALLLVR